MEFAALFLTIVADSAFAQAGAWTTGSNNDGTATVSYRISDGTDPQGGTLTLIEWDASTSDTTALADLVSVMKDPTRHKEFLDAGASEQIRAISDHEWVVYYLFPGPGPIPDTDCVTRMVLSEDAAGKSAVFTLTADPTLLESRGLRRCSLYDVSYTLGEAGDGRVEVRMKARVSPTINVPQWLIRTSFPRTPIDIVTRLVALANPR